jgi:hypothetical protein
LNGVTENFSMRCLRPLRCTAAFSGTHYSGLSWTTKLPTAALFAYRGGCLGREAAIAVGTISKRDPKLYFPTRNRGEYEIVCRPTLMHTPETLRDLLYRSKQPRKLKS